MKRMVLVLLVLVMGLSLLLSACGAPKTFADAVVKAEARLAKWDSDNYNGYNYTSVYPENEGSFTVIMIARMLDSAPGMYTLNVAKPWAEEVYEDIEKCFSSVGTPVVIVIASQDGNILYMFDSGDFE